MNSRAPEYDDGVDEKEVPQVKKVMVRKEVYVDKCGKYPEVVIRREPLVPQTQEYERAGDVTPDSRIEKAGEKRDRAEHEHGA